MHIPFKAACGAASVTLVLGPGAAGAHAEEAHIRSEQVHGRLAPGVPQARRASPDGREAPRKARAVRGKALKGRAAKNKEGRARAVRQGRGTHRTLHTRGTRAGLNARMLAELQQAVREQRAKLVSSWEAKAEKAVRFALQQRGRPYVWGGTGASGYDCSGLVQQAWRNAGVAIPRVTTDQFAGVRTHVARTQLRPGDLIFFNRLAHVGMFLGGDRFVHSPRPGRTVTVEKLRGHYRTNFAGAVRPGWKKLPAIPTSLF
ncbi:C40 family peptidase [Actinomadura parmotrematis]|uniref:C40 family peptidase n=1 Tax=Actinomadura parmotrematis TaxID=2864039 RepID=A0ABS7G4D0_9ACTN|nr:C40 family peptidase [Actinomadura parmotrematis]MBW8487543.1 C40 family peptidase [Actinomadura parmotrematis]